MPLIVDNTLATPYLCRPFEHGADIVVHSLTKFMGGHGNSIGGVIVDGGTFNWSAESGRYPLLSEPRPEYHGVKLHETFGNFAFAIACRVLGLRDLGPAISPFNAFLFITGIETLPLRMQRHSDKALAVAKWLAKHDEVTWVSYAGLPGDRYHNLAKRYIPKGAGAVLTFGVRGGYAAGVKIVEGVQALLTPRQYRRHALAHHPPSVDHPQPALGRREGAAGAGPDVVRLSVGLEDVEDIIADLEQALTGACDPAREPFSPCGRGWPSALAEGRERGSVVVVLRGHLRFLSPRQNPRLCLVHPRPRRASAGVTDRGGEAEL